MSLYSFVKQYLQRTHVAVDPTISPALLDGELGPATMDLSGRTRVILDAESSVINNPSGVINQNPTNGGSPIITGSNGFNAVQVAPGSKISFAVSNPNFEPLSQFTLNFQGSADFANWNPISVTPKSVPLNSAPVTSISHSNSTLAIAAIINNILTTISNHGFSVGQQIFLGQSSATANGYLQGIYGPTVTAVSTTTGLFTANNTFVVGQPIYFNFVTATGFAVNTQYYIASATATNFSICLVPGGATIVPSAFTTCAIAGAFIGTPYYITSTPSATTFTIGSTPTTTLTLTGTPVIGQNQINNVHTISGLAANVLTTSAAHGYTIGQEFIFGAVGSITGATANTVYYVLTTPLATTFTLSATPGGSTLALGGTFTGSSTVTASSGVVTTLVAGLFTTDFAHGFSYNQPIVFASAGSASNMVANTTYYVNTIPAATTFTIAATPGGPTLATGSPGTLPTFNVSSSITATAPGVGLFTYTVPAGVNFVRVFAASLTGVTSVLANIDNFGTSNTVNIPFTGGISTPSGTPVVPPLETSNLSFITTDLSIFAGTSIQLIYSESNDPLMSPYNAQGSALIPANFALQITSIAVSGVQIVSPRLKYFKSVLQYVANMTYVLNGVSAVTGNSGELQPVSILPNIPINVAQFAGTAAVNGGAAGSIGIGGIVAHSTASSANPIIIGGKVVTAVDLTLVAGDVSQIAATTSQQVVTKPFAGSELDLYVVAPAGGSISNSTTPVTILSAPAAGIRNNISAIQLETDALATASEFVLRDVALTCASQTIAANVLTTSTNHGLAVGDAIVASASGVTGLTAGVTYYVLTVPAATTMTLSATPGGAVLAISGTSVTATLNHIIWRTKLQTAGVLATAPIDFPTPLKGGTAVAQEIVTLTASVTGAVYFNCQGYRGV